MPDADLPAVPDADLPAVPDADLPVVPDADRPGVPDAGQRVAVALAFDVVCVLAFVLVGRRTHHDAGVLAGLLLTAWPFLAALTAGWLAARAWRRPLLVRPTGVIVWVVTVVGGLALRGLNGGGLAPAFLTVTTLVLALLLLGWRAVAAVLARRRSLTA